MLAGNPSDGWKRIESCLDVEIEHGVPVRISNTNTRQRLNELSISYKIQKLTGLKVSVDNWINITPGEQEWSVCVDQKEFSEVLRRLALSSAAMFVDRFHKPIDKNAVDWDRTEYSYDFNHAIEHCCIPFNTLNKDYYFEEYIKVMHEESQRLYDEGISPAVEPE